MALRVAIYDLNQWALDFEGNTRRILNTIKDAVKENAAYRVGPELEICGYSLDDSYFELDTVEHCWQCLAKILKETISFSIIVDVGMPVRKDCALYNCRLVIYRGHILFIRAKTRLAKDGVYRENRYFTAWDDKLGSTLFELPQCIRQILGQQYVLFGSNFIFELAQDPRISQKSDILFASYTGNLKIGYEICQELWEPENLSSKLYSNFGCHLVVNSSASYWQLRKLKQVRTYIKDITARCGGYYAFSNMLGCDGQRVVFYGHSTIFENGKSVSEAPNDLLSEFNRVLYDLDVRQVEQYRSQSSIQAVPIVTQSINLTNTVIERKGKLFEIKPSIPYRLVFDDTSSLFNSHTQLKSPLVYHLRNVQRFEAEIYNYTSLWLWDYLRRANLAGFIMPLSGGLDSSSVAMIVFSLSNMLYDRLVNPRDSDKSVAEYFLNKHKLTPENISGPQDICGCLLHCVYLSTRHSGSETRQRAKSLAERIGAKFRHVSIDDFYGDMRSALSRVNFNSSAPDDDEGVVDVEGAVEVEGERTEEHYVGLIDQNLQARLRMVATYYLSGGERLVLATGNVDEALVGYMTKYDCSSADLNPIGGICKNDLRAFLEYCAAERFEYDAQLSAVIRDIIAAPPSAELSGADQLDEADIGLTYDEIHVLGRVRRGEFGAYGPVNVFKHIWTNRTREPFVAKIRCLVVSLDAHDNHHQQLAATGGFNDNASRLSDLAKIVKRFFTRYATNRHKQTVLTPALHAETYSPDDNRFDHRQILYPRNWDAQFSALDALVQTLSAAGEGPTTSAAATAETRAGVDF